MKRIIHEVVQRSERWMLVDEDGTVRELLRRELPALPEQGAATEDAAPAQDSASEQNTNHAP